MEVEPGFHEFSDPELAKIWRNILRPGAAKDEQFVNKYYNWRRPLSIQGLLGQPRIWMSWAYKAAYPKLATFLEKASLDSKFRARVILEDIENSEGLFQHRRIYYNEAHAALSVIFDALKTFPTQLDGANPFAEKTRDTAHVKRFARIIHITDISPVVLSCVFGTIPSLDTSHIAAFSDRHLNGANWGKVNLLQIQSLGWSSFIYEYHFSFYYVTLECFDSDTVKPDPRKVRRSCPFGQARNGKYRYIHEETVSFLLCGHFDDAFSCIQLGDAYFKPRYTKSTGPRAFRSYDPNQSPGQFLLYWIAVGLFHARSRWENAINSLDSEIKSPADVVFMEDRSDLMADDPQFSLSKTYFWALQTYKLFERTLEETITTWENFKKESLPKARDGRISTSDWDAAVESIDQAIEQLRHKIARVRRGIQDVKDLREGLQSTATIFDSRTAVRQGENIRLLTYFTLLFLPLTFGTDIFGMQIIESTPKTIRAFAITLPVITVVTILIIFNLDTTISAFESSARAVTSGLQRQMRLHYRKDWKDRAHALHEDYLTKEPPARKAAKQSSHWVYMLFLIEAAVVVLPVSEVNAALNCYGLFSSEEINRADSSENLDVDTEPRNILRAEVRRRVKRAAHRAKEEELKRRENEKGVLRVLVNRVLRRSFRIARLLVLTILGFFRVLLLPIWIMLLFVEYALITMFFVLISGHRSHEESPPKTPPTQENTSPFLQAWRILGLDTITFSRRNMGYISKSSDEFSPESLQNQQPGSKAKRGKENTVPADKSNHTSTASELLRPDNLGPLPSTTENADGGANYETSTFTARPGQTTAMRRISRAMNYASHGGGFIPGDFARKESPGS